MIPIREDIIANPPFQYSDPLLVVLRVTIYLDFGDTREVLLIDPYYMCFYNRNECVLTIEMNKPLETHENIFWNS